MTFTVFLASGLACFAVGMVIGWICRRETRADEDALRRSREHLEFVRQKKREMDGKRA